MLTDIQIIKALKETQVEFRSILAIDPRIYSLGRWYYVEGRSSNLNSMSDTTRPLFKEASDY
jgi:hypothetical protein